MRPRAIIDRPYEKTGGCVKSLPLMREVDFAKQKTEGEKKLAVIFSPPVRNQRFLTAPSSEGALGAGEDKGRGYSGWSSFQGLERDLTMWLSLLCTCAFFSSKEESSSSYAAA